MNNLKNSKEIYQSVKPPKELENIINHATAPYMHKKIPSSSKKSYGLKFITPIAACFLLLVLCLNTSSAFAETLSDLPLLGPVAKVLTFRIYEFNSDGKNITVRIPEVSADFSETDDSSETQNISDIKDYTAQINQEIQSAVDERIKESETRIEEYKQAFLETGGTEEEFAKKNIQSVVDYDITYEQGPVVSFIITAYETWSGAYTEQYFYNLNLQNQTSITLEDLLGDDYINIANTSILEQMQARMEGDSDLSYFSADEGGFSSISENQNFYINEVGNPVIVFQKYEIAPGFMGIQEFEIPISNKN
jgi:hypothetical protein